MAVVTPGKDTRQMLLNRRFIGTAMLGLGLAHATIAAMNLSPLMDSYFIGEVLDVNLENTFVVWLSSAALLSIALVAFAAAWLDPAKHTHTGWAVIGFAFVLLSVDETASLHELAGELAGRVASVSWLPSLYTWVIVVAPVAAIGAVWMLRWLGRTLGWRTAEGRMAVIAILMWMTVPLLEAVDPTLGGPRLLVVIEESIEAGGEVLLLWAVLLHVAAFDRRLPEVVPG